VKKEEPNIVFQENKKSGVIYAYEDRPYWNSKKKQARSNRKLLGKVDPLTGDIVATRERKARVPTAETPVNTNASIESVQIIKKILVFLGLFVSDTLAKRIISMVLITAGLPNNRVTELVGLGDQSLRKLRKGLADKDFDDMFHVGGGGRKGKLDEVEGLIVEEISKNNYHSHQQIADMVYEKYGVKVSLPVIGRLLKKQDQAIKMRFVASKGESGETT